MARRKLSALVVFAIASSLLLTFGCGGSSTTTPAVQIAVTPSAVTLATKQQQTFLAAVSNATNTGVSWSVQESQGGSITSSGVYTAPATTGTFHVIATSHADATKTATSTITVKAAPAPVFTSNWPTEASEGEPYTYTLAAADSAGGSVTFSLESAPDGATLNGNQVSWTPTRAQSRTPDTFKVTATSSAGSAASQSWSISPTGTIRGVRYRIYVWNTGQADNPVASFKEPVDLSANSFHALVAEPSGSIRSLPGYGRSDGTFEIRHVPAGKYLLESNHDALSWGSFETDKSDLDLSYAYDSRPDPVANTANQVRQLHLTGLDTTAGSELRWMLPNLDEFDWLGYAPGTATADVTGGMRSLADASQGDTAWVNQWAAATTNGYSYSQIAKSSGPLPVTDQNGQNTQLSVTMTTPAQLALHPIVNSAEFAALHPNLPANASIEAGLLGMASPRNDLLTADWDDWYSDSPPLAQLLLQFYLPSQHDVTNVDVGAISIGNPYPSDWPSLWRLQLGVRVPIAAPGATDAAEFFLEHFMLSEASPTDDHPIRPVLGAVVSGTVDGKDLFADQTGISLSPTLSWQPPALGKPTAYLISIHRVYQQKSSQGISTGREQVENVLTTSTGFTVPPGFLLPGSSYIVNIAALSDAGVDHATNPNQWKLPLARVDSLSAILTTTSQVTQADMAAQQVVQPMLAQRASRRKAAQDAGANRAAPAGLHLQQDDRATHLRPMFLGGANSK